MTVRAHGNPLWLGPSILTADFGRLTEAINAAEAAGVDYFHLDVMDGRFVPNLTFGMPVVAAIRQVTKLPLDVHFMTVEPERLVPWFIEAGADAITVHVETCGQLHATIQSITSSGLEAGVTLNPATPLNAVEEILPFVQKLLVMTVNPGFGGQTFIPAMLDKISRARALIDARNLRCRLQVDGGVKAGNIRRVIDAGADTIVVGSGIYNDQQTVAEAVSQIRAAMRG